MEGYIAELVTIMSVCVCVSVWVNAIIDFHLMECDLRCEVVCEKQQTGIIDQSTEMSVRQYA